MRVFSVALLVLLAWPRSAQAGGLFLTDRGVRPAMRGFAFVAGADDPQSIWYNPAGLAWSDQQLLLDATLTFMRASFTRVDDAGNTLTPVDVDATPLPIPMLAYSHPVNDQWTLGFGVHAPNAALLKWPRGVRADGSSCDHTGDDYEDPTCGPAPQRYSLYSLEGSAFLNVTAAVAWRPIPQLSIGLGAHLLLGSFVGEVMTSACDGFLCSQPESPEWDSLVRFSLSPVIQPGFAFGITYDAGLVRVGASMVYWPGAVSGDAKLDARLPSAALFEGARIEGDTARLELDLPLMLRGGVELRPTEGLRIEAALVWEHWSTQSAAKITPKNVWIRDAVAIGDYQLGNIDIPRNMNDVFSIRLGASLALANNRVVPSVGVNYENSSFDDAYLTPLTLDSSKLIVSAGVSVQLTDGFWLDIAYAHVFLENRNVTNSMVGQPNPIRPPRNPDIPPNEGGVSTIGNGRYSMEADMVGIGIRYQFDTEDSVEEEEVPAPIAPMTESQLEPEPEAQRQPEPMLSPGIELGEGESMILEAVAFEQGSDELTSGSEAALDVVLQWMRHTQGLRIQIRGHTDSLGAEEANRDLSERRARAVVDWLAARGIADGRMEAVGVGEAEPIETNRTRAGRARNRRIELRRLD